MIVLLVVLIVICVAFLAALILRDATPQFVVGIVISVMAIFGILAVAIAMTMVVMAYILDRFWDRVRGLRAIRA